MQQEISSIFNQNFVQEISIRRRDLMPLGLKILVWFFLVITITSLIIRGYFYLTTLLVGNMNGIYGIGNFFSLGDSLFTVLQIVSYIFILSEIKSAIFFGLIITGLTLLFGLYSFVSFWFSDLHYGLEIIDGVKCILQSVFFLLLFRIKKDWETKALSGRELRRK